MTTQSGAQDSPQRQWWQLWITVAVLLAFGSVAVYMLAVATDSDSDVWQRRVYVFSGVQAIAFTAVGWLFGREVNSGAKAEARQASAALADARGKEKAVRATVGVMAQQEAGGDAAQRNVERAGGSTSVRRVQQAIEQIYSK
jgi:hypothetical protein